jgi:hypothetical protein
MTDLEKLGQPIVTHDGNVVTPSQSPNRHTFQRDAYVARQEDEGKDISDEYVAMLEQIRLQEKNKWADPERQIDNLEYDLVTTDWILAKARASESYSQNLYAAMCNNDFQRNDVWPRLSDQKWHCSWRYAGGIIADMHQKGDYIDWYCSGIRGDIKKPTEEEWCSWSNEEQQLYIERNKFVSESIVTDEIRKDLLQLGWLVIEDSEE